MYALSPGEIICFSTVEQIIKMFTNFTSKMKIIIILQSIILFSSYGKKNQNHIF